LLTAVPSLPFLFDLVTSYPPHAGGLHSQRERERERERERDGAQELTSDHDAEIEALHAQLLHDLLRDRRHTHRLPIFPRWDVSTEAPSVDPGTKKNLAVQKKNSLAKE
jgi:hypothetical protein